MIGFLFNMFLLGAAITLSALGLMALLALGIKVLIGLIYNFMEWLIDIF